MTVRCRQTPYHNINSRSMGCRERRRHQCRAGRRTSPTAASSSASTRPTAATAWRSSSSRCRTKSMLDNRRSELAASMRGGYSGMPVKSSPQILAAWLLLAHARLQQSSRMHTTACCSECWRLRMLALTRAGEAGQSGGQGPGLRHHYSTFDLTRCTRGLSRVSGSCGLNDLWELANIETSKADWTESARRLTLHQATVMS